MKKFILILCLSLISMPSLRSEIIEINGVNQQADILIKKDIGPGVTYTRLRLPDYPLNVNMMVVDLNNPYNKIETTVGSDKLGSTESLVTAATRQSSVNHRPIGAANANFWCTTEQPYTNYIKGTTFGANLRNGKILTETNMYSNQWDGGAARTGIVSIDKDKKLWIESMSWSGKVTSSKWGTNSFDIAQVNKMCNNNELVMYNSYYGTTRAFTLTDATLARTDVFLSLKAGQDWAVNKDMICEVREIKANTGSNTLGSYDLCLSGTGAYKNYLEQLAVGDEVTVKHGWKSLNTNDEPYLDQIVAGNAIVLKDGELTGRNTDEAYNSQVYSRTGYGMSKDGKTLYVIVIDKSTDPVYGLSAGCGTNVMCQIAKHFGCWNLCTMDAGGSAQMMVDNQIINKTTEGTPRAVANGWMIYSIAEPETEIARIEFLDPELIAPIYSTYSPTILGYDKFGNLINENVEGVALSCTPNVGTTDGSNFIAAGLPAEGELTATYKGLSVTKSIKVEQAAMAIRIKNLLIDGTRNYPVEVIANINNNTYYYNPASLTWSVADPSVVSIDSNGVLKGLKNGTTTISCSLGNFSDQSNVTVEIAPTPTIEQKYDNWTIACSAADNLILSNDGILSLSYKGGRGPNIKLTKDVYFYSLPDKIIMEFNSTLPISSIRADFRSATMSSNLVDIKKDNGFSTTENNIIEFPLAGLGDMNDLINYPISLHSLIFYIGTGATTGENSLKFNSFRSEYAHSSGVENAMQDRSNKLYIYPNPVSETLNIYCGNTQSGIMTIYNNAGSLVMQKNINFNGEKASIDVTGLFPGIYFVKLQSESNNSVEKIIIK